MSRPRASKATSTSLASLPKTTAAFVEPMRAKLVSTLPEGDDWLYEVKFDGYRALAIKRRAGIELRSRNDSLLTSRFPRIARALAALETDTVLDGEILALDAAGRPAFNLLQKATPTTPVVYYVFDIMTYRGRRLLGLPLGERRKLLRSVLSTIREPIRVSETFRASPTELVDAARRQGLEGLVAKRSSSVYEPGRRSGAWLKVRLQAGQELVVGGYLPGPHRFDALLVGYYARRRLLFIAKVRNGFVPQTRRDVARRFAGLETDVCPFANLPEPKNARRGQALTAQAMRQCRWLKPKLVVQVGFADWTAGNHPRHARFLGIRDDKDARDVVREIPAQKFRRSTS